MTIVIKIGGAALEDASTLRKCARAIVELADGNHHQVAVVHGADQFPHLPGAPAFFAGGARSRASGAVIDDIRAQLPRHIGKTALPVPLQQLQMKATDRFTASG